MSAPPERRRAAAVLAGGAVAMGLLLAAVPALAQPPLRTFRLPKLEPPPPAVAGGSPPVDLAPERLPPARESLRATIGLGYVQGADWGSEVGATGSIRGIRVHLDALTSRGRAGLRLDRGTLLLSDPGGTWRAAAGDVFSPLHGASRGVRVSWQARGQRQPALALHAAGRRRSGDGGDGPPMLSYRDQLRLGRQMPLDVEVSTGGAWLVASRWRFRPVDLEASYRRRPGRQARDASIVAGVDVWRGVRVGTGWLRSSEAGDPSTWRSFSLRLPVARWLDVTLERTLVTAADRSSATYAVMAGGGLGSARFFHRFQHQRGEAVLEGTDVDAVFGHEQLQSMATYAAGPRLNLTMQLATAWTETGRPSHWQELLASVALSSSTRLQVAAGIPDVSNPDRLRLRLTQDLPARFAVVAEFGRVSAFQPIRPGQAAPRARVMLTRSWQIATPARGGLVAGRVVDHAGNAVAGARVTLGPFAVDTDAAGHYRFSPLPDGHYELALDEHLLPASYAWDRHRRLIDVTSSSRIHADLRVTPLNAIHGRVVADRDANGRVDGGEGVPGAVVRIGDRVTATDERGAYAFFDLWPGDYLVELDILRLPEGLGPGPFGARPVTLRDDQPATGADFLVRPVTKPIVWRRKGAK